MTNTPTPKTTAARKGSPSKSTKPAAKSTTKAAAKAAPKPAVKSTTKPKPAAKAAAKPVEIVKPAAKRALDPAAAERLVTLHNFMLAATEEFETALVDLLRAGESPTHVAHALDIANSSVRRIGFRYGIGIDPAKR